MVKADPLETPSNPCTVYWMDVSDASYYIPYKKITKIKVAEWGTPKKIFKKIQSFVYEKTLNIFKRSSNIELYCYWVFKIQFKSIRLKWIDSSKHYFENQKM